MFLRMLVRAALLRRGRALSALLAMAVAAATATAVLNLYVDVQAKLGHEFRKYGANLVVVGKDGPTLPANALSDVDDALGGRGTAAPFAFVVARAAAGQSVVVAGTDFDRARRLDGWWSVTAWPGASQEALIGVRAAALVSASEPFDLSFQGRILHVRPVGILRTGAAEDSRIYLSLRDFEAWTNVPPSVIEIATPGNASQIERLARTLANISPNANVRPVRQIVEGETLVLGKTRATLLASAVLITLTAALCVLATLTGWVFDRRKDFAVMKALGASQRLIGGFFAAEAAVLGAAGAAIGFAAGALVADWIGRVNFHAPVAVRLNVLPVVLAGSVAVALLAAILPMSLLRRVQPAMILKGE